MLDLSAVHLEPSQLVLSLLCRCRLIFCAAAGAICTSELCYMQLWPQHKHAAHCALSHQSFPNDIHLSLRMPVRKVPLQRPCIGTTASTSWYRAFSVTAAQQDPEQCHGANSVTLISSPVNPMQHLHVASEQPIFQQDSTLPAGDSLSSPCPLQEAPGSC